MAGKRIPGNRLQQIRETIAGTDQRPGDDPKALRSLLTEMGDLEVPLVPNGITPAMYAAKYGATRCLRMLIGWGADPEAVSASGDTLLSLAAEFDRTNVLSLLQRLGHPLDCRMQGGDCAIHRAARNDAARALRWLVESAGFSPDIPDEIAGNTPLHIAASCGYTKSVRTLLDLGANILAVNDRNQTPADLAAENKRPAVRAMLDRHANELNEYLLMEVSP